MPLSKTYPEDFERLYRAWPSYPTGRTKKHLAAKAFAKAKKDFEFTPHDVTDLVALVGRMKKDRKSWQKGNPYGPQGLQVWLNQAGWQDEYETVHTKAGRQTESPDHTETADEIAAKIEAYRQRFEEARQQHEKRKAAKARGIL